MTAEFWLGWTFGATAVLIVEVTAMLLIWKWWLQ